MVGYGQSTGTAGYREGRLSTDPYGEQPRHDFLSLLIAGSMFKLWACTRKFRVYLSQICKRSVCIHKDYKCSAPQLERGRESCASLRFTASELLPPSSRINLSGRAWRQPCKTWSKWCALQFFSCSSLPTVANIAPRCRCSWMLPTWPLVQFQRTYLECFQGPTTNGSLQRAWCVVAGCPGLPSVAVKRHVRHLTTQAVPLIPTRDQKVESVRLNQPHPQPWQHSPAATLSPQL